jgi:hypothetical protein
MEVQQPPSTKVKPSRIPPAIAKTLASDRPHGPHMGKKGWDDPKWDTSGTDNMSDDEEAPSRHHVDRLDKAGIQLDSCTPPRRLVLSPQRPQASSSRPSALTRLKYPPHILDRLSAFLDKHALDAPPTCSHLVKELSIQGTTSSLELDQELLDAVSNENECSIMGDGYNSDPYEENMDSAEDQEHVVSHRNGSNNATYGAVMQLTEVAFNLPVEAHVPIEPPPQVSTLTVPWVETHPEQLMTTSTSPGPHPDKDCSDWLSDHPVKPYNLAPQEPVSKDKVQPPVKPPVILPVTDWVAKILLDTDWDSISPEDNRVDHDPAIPEPTSQTTPEGESTGSPTGA